MFYFVLSIHLLLCLVLIGLVLIQQGKGADMGAAFGGSSNTLFGAAGATAFITKLTTGIAVAFMVTSIILVNLYTSHARSNVGAVSTSSAVDELLGAAASPQKSAASGSEAPAEKAAPQEAAPVVPPVPAAPASK